MTTLFDLKPFKKAVIKKINTDKQTKERLHSLGLIKDVEINFVQNAPLGCPKIYKCFNTLIALRGSTAKKIDIKIINKKANENKA
jgi:Fe2+ transport system protein FeoA